MTKMTKVHCGRNFFGKTVVQQPIVCLKVMRVFIS